MFVCISPNCRVPAQLFFASLRDGVYVSALCGCHRKQAAVTITRGLLPEKAQKLFEPDRMEVV